MLAWGVLGTGTVARQAILPALEQSAQGQVLALASADQQRATELAARFGVPRAYGSYAALVEDTEIEAVYIALPNHLHHEWTVRALAAGKHVLCEKPLALAVAEVDAMAAAAQAAGKLLMEALMYRFHPRVARVRELLASGEIGEVEAVQATFCFTLADQNNYRLHLEQGGGALLDVGGYCVSAVHSLMGAEPLIVQATARYGPTGPVGIDESSSALLAFPEGRTAQITCSFRAAEEQRVTVIGTQGVLEIPYPAFTAWHSDPAPIIVRHGARWREMPGAAANPYQIMLARFTQAALRHEPAPYSLTESRATVQTLEAIARAARSREPQSIY